MFQVFSLVLPSQMSLYYIKSTKNGQKSLYLSENILAGIFMEWIYKRKITDEMENLMDLQSKITLQRFPGQTKFSILDLND